MAYPVVRFNKVEISVKNAWTGDMFTTQDATLEDMSMGRADVFKKFNKELFEAFSEQRKYTIIGIALLCLSLILQNASF